MRLIEKKCPNCGATLEFNENDKSCKCNYCKRSFEIERDTDNLDKFNLIYDKMQKPIQTVLLIPFVCIFVFALIIMVSIFTFNHSSSKKVTNTNKKDNPTETVIEEKLLKDVSEISNRDFDLIDSHATSKIHRTGEGVNDTKHSYSINGNISREKLFVAYKEGHNYLIIIYKATYHDFFHQENQYTVYIPVLFENIEKSIISSLGNATLKAPEFYFNNEKTSYTYGYANYEQAYKEVIEPLKEDYKISEK